MLYHFWPSRLPGGFLGVDIFFVLSGFLMIVMLDKYNQLQFKDVVHFYMKRFFKVLPIVVGLRVLVSLPFCFLLNVEIVDNFLRSVNSTLLGVSNSQFWREAGYFDISAHRKPLLHSWFLSVELQFYLLVPLIYLVARLLFRTMLWVYFGWAPCLNLLSLVFTAYFPGAGFYLMPIRMGVFWYECCPSFGQPKRDGIPFNKVQNSRLFDVGVVALVITILIADTTYQHPES